MKNQRSLVKRVTVRTVRGRRRGFLLLMILSSSSYGHDVTRLKSIAHNRQKKLKIITGTDLLELLFERQHLHLAFLY